MNLPPDNFELTTPNSKLPQAPWRLTGNAALLLSNSGGAALVRYQTSPVGAYEEFARCVLTKRGPRVVEMLVTSEKARRGGIENWGFPKQLADLRWQQRAKRIEFRKGDAVYRLRAFGPRIPLCVRFFCVQTLNNQEVRVPFSLRGKARLAWRGRQIALLVEDFVFDVEAPK